MPRTWRGLPPAITLTCRSVALANTHANEILQIMPCMSVPCIRIHLEHCVPKGLEEFAEYGQMRDCVRIPFVELHQFTKLRCVFN
jgi:hypothetical protein